MWYQLELIFISSSISSCELCRHNKLKCDGQHPCSRCLRTERQCDYTDFQTASERGDAFQDVDIAQQTKEAQQYSAEKLRLLENIFFKLHPDIRTDDLSALRNYNSRDVDYTTSMDKAVTRHPHRNLTTSPRPEDVGLEALGRQEGIGRTPMPTATITVINQGKTRTSKTSKSSVLNIPLAKKADLKLTDVTLRF